VGAQTLQREAVASCERVKVRVRVRVKGGAVAYIYARNCRIHLHIHKFSLSAPKATVAAPKNATFSILSLAQDEQTSVARGRDEREGGGR